MSGAVVKKVQPFTIGTKLSMPAEHRHQDNLVADAVNSPEPQGRLDHLQRQTSSRDRSCSDVPVAPQAPCDDDVEEDRGSMSPTASSRSIRKIVICRRTGVVGATGVHRSSNTPPAERGSERSCSPHSKNSQQEAEFSQDVEQHEDDPATNPPSEHLLRWLHSNLQQDVQLALDVSWFYQQADTILTLINREMTEYLARENPDITALQREAPSGAADIDNIASQITLLEQAAMRLSDLHPTLTDRVTLKQAEVMDSWTLYQAKNRSKQTAERTRFSEEEPAGLVPVVQEATTSTAKTLLWLSDSVSITPSQQWLGNTGNQTVRVNRDQSMNTATNHCGKNPTLTLQTNRLLSRCAELSMDILDTETNMVVRCEPAAADVDGLQEQQGSLEVELQLVRQNVEEMESMTSDHLQAACPDEAGVLTEDLQASQQACDELSWSVAENRTSLRQIQQTQDFLRTYLNIISWAEETRACVFTEIAMQKSQQAELGDVSELERRIQQQSERFDELVKAGQRLVKGRDHLAGIIRDRNEELRSMLEWILVHWKTHRDTFDPKEIIQGSTDQCRSSPEQNQSRMLSPETDLSSVRTSPSGSLYSAELREAGEDNITALHQDLPDKSPCLVVEEPRAAVTPLGGSICLILTMDPEAPELGRSVEPAELTHSEPLHKVSTYVQVTDGTGLDFSSEGSASPPISSSSTTTFLPKVSTVLLPAAPPISTHSLPASVRRKKRAPHRHTVTGLAGVDRSGPAGAVGPSRVSCRANTWPMEDKKRAPVPAGRPGNTELQLYVRNNSVVPVAQENRVAAAPSLSVCADSQADKTMADLKKSHFSIPLGATLRVDLPKNWEDLSQISAGGLTIVTQPQESAAGPGSPDTLSSNLHTAPIDDHQANISSRMIREVRTVDSELGTSGENGKGDVALVQGPSILEEDKSPFKESEESMLMDTCKLQQPSNTARCQDENEVVIHQDGIADGHKACTETQCCSSNSPEHAKHFHRSNGCVSVHTKLCHLKDHIYHSPKWQLVSGQTRLITQQVKRLSHASVNLTPPGVHRDRVVVCSEEDCTLCSSGSRAVVRKESPSMELGYSADPLRPDHWQFEEVEVELEDIWNASVDKARAP